MTKVDLDRYRIDFDKSYWMDQADGSHVILPVKILDAVRDLCDEVERLMEKKGGSQ